MYIKSGVMFGGRKVDCCEGSFERCYLLTQAIALASWSQKASSRRQGIPRNRETPNTQDGNKSPYCRFTVESVGNLTFPSILQTHTAKPIIATF